MIAHFIFCFLGDDGLADDDDDDDDGLALGLAGVSTVGGGKVGRAHTSGLFDFRTLFT